MTEYECRQMPRCEEITSEVMVRPNAMMHADLTKRPRDVSHQVQSNAAAMARRTGAMDRHTKVMARVARRLGDLEGAIDR